MEKTSPNILQNKAKIKTQFTILLFLVLIIGSMVRVEFDLARLIYGIPKMGRLLSQMWPPDWIYVNKIFGAMLETLRMALLGTTFGALLAVPLSFFSARNVTRSPFFYVPARFIMNIIRAIPDLLLAAIFVAIFGIGPLAGIFALTFFSFGLITKLTYETIEGVDLGPLEAMTAVGANKLQWLHFGVLPQVIPHFVSYVLLTFEINVRAAAVLGLVGAGGIGLFYDRTLGLLQYDKTATIILLTMAIVFIIDWVSIRIREKLL